MLSAWRRLTRKQDEKPVFPAGVSPIDQSMAKKYSKGVHYNMKIIIKGDRNTGKSTLLHRLSGGKFKEEYLPTHEIQVANVNWNYRGPDDIIKVEVWDIVDKSQKKRTASDSLKITNNDEVQESQGNGFALDAEFVNVYKGTHGVILIMDITKAWTWKYVQRELENIPHSIPVLVLANFRDMGDHRVVQTDEIIALVENLERPTGSAEVYFSEASMKNGFGLCFIYKFFNMPFLLLQREALLRQLEANTLEIEDTREGLSIDIMSAEQNYGLFKDMMAESLHSKEEENNSPSQTTDQQEKPVADTSNNENEQSGSVGHKEEPQTKISPAAAVLPTENQNNGAPKRSKLQEYKAKLFGTDSTPKASNDKPQTLTTHPKNHENVAPIDEFSPGQLDDTFLGGNTTTKNIKSTVAKNKDYADSDEEDDGNPMVAAYEDLESEDEQTFEQQTSIEADFDDLSDDERRKIEDNEHSILQQIKSSKRKKEDINNVIASTQELDISKEPVLEGVDKVEVKPTVIKKHSDGGRNDSIANPPLDTSDILSNGALPVTKQESVNDSDEDDTQVEVNVITGDVDVEDDVDFPNENGGKAVEGVNTNDSSKDVNSSINFDLDDLEMFMNNQLSHQTAEVETKEETVTEKPKKKKKKKVTPESTEGSESIERKKKKKKKIKVAETSNESSATVEKKSSMDGNKKKKHTSKSDYEAFFDN